MIRAITNDNSYNKWYCFENYVYLPCDARNARYVIPPAAGTLPHQGEVFCSSVSRMLLHSSIRSPVISNLDNIALYIYRIIFVRKLCKILILSLHNINTPLPPPLRVDCRLHRSYFNHVEVKFMHLWSEVALDNN